MTDNIFVTLLQQAGCRLDTESKTAVLTAEPVIVRRELLIRLRSDQEYPNNIEQFVESMSEYLQETQNLRKCLLPAQLSETVAKAHRSSTVESPSKMLLAIDILQPQIITYLLERLPEFYDELENDNSSSCTARLILQQLRWLEYIVEPQSLTGKLIEVIQVTPTILQHEIITSLPDIINDSEHKPMVVYLKELMQQNTELTVPILDALSNLTLHSESLDDVRDTVLERLESAELDDLAIILRFLLQTASPHSVDLVVYSIREKLDFRALGKVQENEMRNGAYNSTQQPPNGSKRGQAPEALILESIKLGLQFHKFVCDSWVRSITALEMQSAHKIIDVLVLFILHSMTSMKKKAEQILRKKIVSGLITASLLEETIMQHAHGLASYWNTILSLSESLLRSGQQQSAVAPCSRALYISAFKSSDPYYRQEIVGSLVTHIGSGSYSAEMDIALDILLRLVQQDVKSMIVYSVFIKGVLDYLDNLSLSQMRVLFDIFSILALKGQYILDGGNGNLWSDIQIVVRKQLSNPRERYKKIGIIACLAAVKVLGSKDLCEDNAVGGSSTQTNNDQFTPEQALRHPLLQQAISLLEMAMRSCAEYPTCQSLMYDELAHIIVHNDLDMRLQLWIKENFTSCFTDNYVIDVEETESIIAAAAKNDEIGLKPSVRMHLDGEEKLVIMNLFSMIYGIDDRKKKKLAVPLCAIFNLLQNCEKTTNNGSLEDIDALLGCGVIIFAEDTVEAMVKEIRPDELQDTCDMLFYCINWFRELLNAFATTTGDEVHSRLIQRLKNILQLENKLNKFIKFQTSYVPLELVPTLPWADAKDTRALRALGKPRHSSDSDNNQVSQNNQGSDVEVKPRMDISARAQSGLSFESVDDLRPFMRPLHIHVLSILQSEDTDPNDASREHLEYSDVNYILRDLNGKLDAKIAPAPVNFFGKKKVSDEKQYKPNDTMLSRMPATEFMNQVIDYLPNILQRLETLYGDIQLQDTQAGRISHDTEDIAECAANIFNILFKLFSWPDIQNPENSVILERLVGSLAARINVDATENLSLASKIQKAFQYLSRFSDNMVQATTAVVLFKTLKQIMAFSSNPDALKRGAYDVVNRILSTDWFDWRNIKKDILFLLEESIALHEDPLHRLHEYVSEVLPLYETEDRLEEHPLLKSDTVIYYYQAMISQTVQALRLLQDTEEETDIVLLRNAQLVKIFERITNYIKTKDQRALFAVLLKTGKSFIEQFTKFSIPYFTTVFRSHKDEIVAIFKEFQTSTRMLQIICSHVKVLKDIHLSAFVPPLKKAMEIVIYQVKMLLTENKAPADAFFLGALKHRDIRGMEVSSQIPREEESESEIEEDEEDELNSTSSDTATSSKKRQVAPPPTKKRRRVNRQTSDDSDRVIRTTSQVPSSSDEEEAEAEPGSAKEDEIDDKAAEPSDNEESIEFNFDSDGEAAGPTSMYDRGNSLLPMQETTTEETTNYRRRQPVIIPTEPITRSETTSGEPVTRPRKRRLGVGRPAIPKKAKVFNLFRESDADN